MEINAQFDRENAARLGWKTDWGCQWPLKRLHRFLRNTKDRKKRPPRHIQEKMGLITYGKNNVLQRVSASKAGGDQRE